MCERIEAPKTKVEDALMLVVCFLVLLFSSFLFLLSTVLIGNAEAIDCPVSANVCRGS